MGGGCSSNLANDMTRGVYVCLRKDRGSFRCGASYRRALSLSGLTVRLSCSLSLVSSLRRTGACVRVVNGSHAVRGTPALRRGVRVYNSGGSSSSSSNDGGGDGGQERCVVSRGGSS